LIAALLADGLQRAFLDLGVAPIIRRMHLRIGNAIEQIEAWSGDPPQVIYLDPMFPHREKTSLVKKEMRIFRPLVGGDDDAPDLLKAALALATHRVVVKRPRKAPSVAGKEPGYTLEGKSSRFDIYPMKAFKAKP
jgi:16S rRNA (guanine1516-N2)-methyltransferase